MDKFKYGYNKQDYKKFTAYAWRYLLLFAVLYCSHYCTRLNFNSAKLEMGGLFNEVELGIISGTLFWSYGIGHLINGRLGEIVGIHKFITLSVILSAATNVIMGFQSNLVVMAILWGFNGYFQSMAWSAGVSSLTAWWPGDKRGFAGGFAHAFSGFGQVVAALMVALSFWLLPNLGWRAAFFLPAALPIIMLVVFKIFAKTTPKSVGLDDYKEEDEAKAEEEKRMRQALEEKGALYPYIHLITNKTFIIWMFVAFATGLARYGLITWIPDYFKKVAELGSIASLLTSTILPIGMGIGTLTVPSLTDKFCPNNRLLAGIVSGIAGAAAIFAFNFVDVKTTFGLILGMVLLFLAGFFIYAVNGTAWAFAQDIGGRVFAGTATGILDFSAYMGAAVQAVVYGFILENGGWNVVFFSIAAFCLLIAVLSLVSSFGKKKD